MLPGKHQQTQAHGYQEHVENSCHVVDVQLTAHHLQDSKKATLRKVGGLREEREQGGGREIGKGK